MAESIDLKKFFDGIRRMYGGKLTQEDVDSINVALEEVKTSDQEAGVIWVEVFGSDADQAWNVLRDCWVEDADPDAAPATPEHPQGASAPGSTVLTNADFVRASGIIGCDVPALRAVVAIEAGGSGFLPDGRPKILFEAHVFGRLTSHRHANGNDRHGVPLSSRAWNRALYGSGGAHQWDRMEDAAKLDWDAAHKAASWGAGQVLGTNFEAAGFDNIRDFVDAMKTGGAGAQLDAMVNFIKRNHLDGALRRHDWAAFARGYNGPGYAQNRYDTKLEEAYNRFA
jgi:hypothetical protein